MLVPFSDGDQLPDAFEDTLLKDFPVSGGGGPSVLIAAGTSLQVAPFCAAVNLPSKVGRKAGWGGWLMRKR